MTHPIDLAFPGEPEFRESPLLDAIQRGQSLTQKRLQDSWFVANNKAVLRAAADPLSQVARGRPEEVPDALLWAWQLGVINAITSMEVIWTLCRLCLAATVTRSYNT